MATSPKRLLLLALAPALVIVGCTSGDDGATETSGVETTTVETTTGAESTATTAEPADTTTTEAVTTTTGLPGEAIDFGPRAGDTVAVIGVAYDDVLNVRSTPGVDGDVATTLAPLTNDLMALGNTRDVGSGFWVELEEGWVNLVYVGYPGVVTDDTAFVVEELGEIPAAETMVDLGLLVAQAFASDDPESDIVQVTEPMIGDLGEITFDVIGLGDDSLRGFRLQVFGTPGDESFGLMSVEVTALCGRGVTEDLLCV